MEDKICLTNFERNKIKNNIIFIFAGLSCEALREAGLFVIYEFYKHCYPEHIEIIANAVTKL